MDKLNWYRGIPNNTSYEYSYGHRYCRCLAHSLGTSHVKEMWYDTENHVWGYPSWDYGEFSFQESHNINPPNLWCYLREAEVLLLHNSVFPHQVK